MTKQIDRQVEEIAFLRDELSKQRDEQSEQSKRHDTIVLHMTQQLDRVHLQLEDKQKHAIAMETAENRVPKRILERYCQSGDVPPSPLVILVKPVPSTLMM